MRKFLMSLALTAMLVAGVASTADAQFIRRSSYYYPSYSSYYTPTYTYPTYTYPTYTAPSYSYYPTYSYPSYSYTVPSTTYSSYYYAPETYSSYYYTPGVDVLPANVKLLRPDVLDVPAPYYRWWR